jgi:hypothetical protein
MSRLDDLAQKRSLLVARADLERMQIALAFQEIRNSVLPTAGPGGGPRWQTFALRALRVVLPAFALPRVRGILGILAAAAAVYRATRSWRSGR